MEGRPQCMACYYYCDAFEVGEEGRCRRRAPTGDQWPLVSRYSWCGDFARWDREVIPYADIAYSHGPEVEKLRQSTEHADHALFKARWPMKIKVTDHN